MSYQVVFYKDARGEKPVAKFLRSLSPEARAKCGSYLRLLEEKGLQLAASHMKKLEKDVYELRPELGGTEYRLVFTWAHEKFYMLHGTKKKADKLSKGDFVTIRRRLEEVQNDEG